jgi:hypothetical protein
MSESEHRPQLGGDASHQRQSTPDEPQYGQRAQPEYGALASQLPEGYDPYIFGRPDPAAGAAASAASAQGDGRQNGGYGRRPVQPNAQATLGSSGSSAPYGDNSGGHGPRQPADWSGKPRNQSGRRPQMLNGVNLDDPGQNPLYGHWDSYAVVAFVLSLFNVPVLPALMGGVAMWRTRTFRMKGFGLALAAVLINVLMTLLDIWMLSKGVSTEELYQWMMQQLSGGSGQGGSGSVSV